eukprot:scaffold9109_cov19-Tisochrysis_lutea.AAC.9
MPTDNSSQGMAGARFSTTHALQEAPSCAATQALDVLSSSPNTQSTKQRQLWDQNRQPGPAHHVEREGGQAEHPGQMLQTERQWPSSPGDAGIPRNEMQEGVRETAAVAGENEAGLPQTLRGTAAAEQNFRAGQLSRGCSAGTESLPPTLKETAAVGGSAGNPAQGTESLPPTLKETAVMHPLLTGSASNPYGGSEPSLPTFPRDTALVEGQRGSAGLAQPATGGEAAE